MTGGGYSFDEWARMHGYDRLPETSEPKACAASAAYDGVELPECFPICDACLKKWLETAP